MSNDQLDRIEAKIDALSMLLLDQGSLRVEGWLRQFFEDSEHRWRHYQICKHYTRWREDQEPPMSGTERIASGHLVYYYLWRFVEEGFISATQTRRGGPFYYQRQS